MTGKNDARVRGGQTLDILKFVLAMLVVARHSIQHYFPSGTDCIIYHMVSGGLSTVAVPTFFAITGYLMYDASFEKVKQHIKRIGRLYLIWSLIYLPLTIFLWRGNHLTLVNNIIEYLQNAVFSGSYYHLWYLPASMVALLMFFLLKEKEYRIRICICLLAVGILTGPYIDLVSSCDAISTVISIYEKIFITTRNGVFIGAPFMLMGILIGENSERIKKSPKWILIVWFAAGFLFLIIETLCLYNAHGDITNNILISDVVIAPSLLAILIRLFEENGKLLVLRKSSTGIYCVHILCIKFVSVTCRKIGFEISALAFIGLCLVISVAVGLLLVVGAQRIKFLRNLL